MPRCISMIVCLVVTMSLGLTGRPREAFASGQQLPNADFTEGDQQPDDWTLSTPEGRWVDRDYLEVTGAGDDSNFWRCEQFRFVPGQLYRFRMLARRTGGSGTVISGPVFANRDFRSVGPEWKWHEFVSRAPDNLAGSYVRLGQWNATGSVQFDQVSLTPCVAVHRKGAAGVLGEGESIREGVYRFDGRFNQQGSNYHRPLAEATAGFNSDRWTLGAGSHVTYRFAVRDCKLLAGRIRVTIGYYVRGDCQVQLSRDGQTWTTVATQASLGTIDAAVPDAFSSVERLWVRVAAAGELASFQVHRVEFEAPLDGDAPDAAGQTVYADYSAENDRLAIDDLVLGDAAFGQSQLHVTAANRSDSATRITLSATVSHEEADIATLPSVSAQVAAKSVHRFSLRIPTTKPGRHAVALSLAADAGEPLRATLNLTVHDYYRSDYGERIESVGRDDLAVWSCDATRKIAPQRPAPTVSAAAASLAAPRNDYEAVQIVVRPDKPLTGLTAVAGELHGPDGAVIAASEIEVLRVYYHLVHTPTDASGARDRWPDALPPLTEPIDVPAGENQPLWVLVHVPTDAAAGDYQGVVRLKADGFAADVPLRLHVWDFALPTTNHLATAFGLSAGNIFRYHQLTSEADKRRVLDMYHESFARHRISPYDPTPLDHIGVKFIADADPPRAELDFTAFDAAMTRAVERYHFTHLRLPIAGMGGGTFHARYEPKIGAFGEQTPEYQAMFASYVGQLERHLKDKGWLEMAYIYWFDEPAPRDYEFVRNGMQRLHKYAPGLTRMLTEEPQEALAGAVDIWCPVSHNYDHDAAQQRRAHGERFWWYVCCGPKAPYCTLFIDHPATELRVWHWQAWQRGVVGSLVWQSNYWTSSAAFPDSAQNPYEDPMGYVSGYSTPRGTRRHWGNGDGRFLYPPLAAATPGASGSEPVIAPPVSSIRWEMLREGVEDYETLYLLRELLGKCRDRLTGEQLSRIEPLLEVPEAITQDMTTFTTDPRPIYQRRANIAEAIEMLRRTLARPGADN